MRRNKIESSIYFLRSTIKTLNLSMAVDRKTILYTQTIEFPQARMHLRKSTAEDARSDRTANIDFGPGKLRTR